VSTAQFKNTSIRGANLHRDTWCGGSSLHLHASGAGENGVGNPISGVSNPTSCYLFDLDAVARECGIVWATRGRAFRFTMRLFNGFSADRGRWRNLLIVVAILSLTLSLVNRFSFSVKSHVHTVRSVDNRAGEPKRLDRDAVRYAAPPIVSFDSFKPAVPYRHVISYSPSPSSEILSLVLYNRPPPNSF
jgi:hypothetical protein